MSSREEITRIIGTLKEGDEGAAQTLVTILYNELRGLARSMMRNQRSNHTLQATALVNEAYIKLMGNQSRDWEDRIHFLKFAARAMRSVLIDHARSKLTKKRTPLVMEAPDQPPEEILAIDEALKELKDLDHRLAQVVELRFFGGLTVEETAKALKISTATVKREWVTAKAWLRQSLKKGGAK